MHVFFTRKSFTQFDKFVRRLCLRAPVSLACSCVVHTQEISATCIFLATKVYEVHKRVTDIVDQFFVLRPIPARPRPTPLVRFGLDCRVLCAPVCLTRVVCA